MVALASMELEAIAASAHLNTQGRPVKMKLKVTFSIGLIELLVHSEVTCINSTNLDSYPYLTTYFGLMLQPHLFFHNFKKIFWKSVNMKLKIHRVTDPQ